MSAERGLPDERKQNYLIQERINYPGACIRPIFARFLTHSQRDKNNEQFRQLETKKKYYPCQKLFYYLYSMSLLCCEFSNTVIDVS